MNGSDFINVRLLSHPVNWLIVWTVLLFGAFAWHFIHQRTTAMPVATA
jgi:hypothetical protein